MEDTSLTVKQEIKAIHYAMKGKDENFLSAVWRIRESLAALGCAATSPGSQGDGRSLD